MDDSPQHPIVPNTGWVRTPTGDGDVVRYDAGRRAYLVAYTNGEERWVTQSLITAGDDHLPGGSPSCSAAR